MNAAARSSSAAQRLPRPGPAFGAYPERTQSPPGAWLALADSLGDRLSPRAWQQGRQRRAFPAALQQAIAAQALDTRPAAAQAADATRLLRQQGFSATAVARAQALLAAAIQSRQGRCPYPTQHLAAWELLQDQLVEMATGEGKSIAMLMAAATAALARVPVHVITANEYLAARDAQAARDVLDAVGLTCDVVGRDMTPARRRQAYACDVVFTTVQETGFDYLRDRLLAMRGDAASETAPRVLRGLCLALVDEADSVLLDHARTPLVLAEEAGHASDQELARAALTWAAHLRPGPDYTLEPQDRRVALNPEVLVRFAQSHAPARALDRRVLAELLRDALVALRELTRDVHYVVQDRRVVLVDATTGRTLPGTVWSRGLHRMVCLKESAEVPSATRTAMQITLQDLLGRYCKLGGTSGTLAEARAELWFFYRLAVRCIAPRLPCRRRGLGQRLYRTHAAQREAVAACVQAARTRGQAVLVGTDSVAAAERLSHHLHACGIPHQLLTARDDQHEAALVGQAGAPGAVTVATNMAGRGTDIPLSPATLAAGGLHVICCAQNPSRRIDRQLRGRSARNGQPGSWEGVLCAEDAALATFLPPRLGAPASPLGGTAQPLSRGAAWALCGWARACSVWSEFVRCWRLARQEKYFKQLLVYAPRAE